MDKVKNTFGMKKIPFSKEIASADLFESLSMKEACARFEVALENEDIALLTGTPGSGKSCILRRFLASLDEKRHKVVYLSGEQTKTGDIAKQVLSRLGMAVPFHGTRAVRELKEVVSNMKKNKDLKLVLVIDEAQELPVTTLASLKMLVNYEMDSRNYLFVLLVGQSELENTLRRSELESLARRIRIRFRATGLTLEETSKYVRHQTRLSGVDRQLISEEAVARVYDFSRGVISLINTLCFEALILAAAESKEIIDPADIEKVAKTGV